MFIEPEMSTTCKVDISGSILFISLHNCKPQRTPHMNKLFLFLTVIFLFFAALSIQINGQDFAKGADVSWLTEMEASGRKFYSATGSQTECMSLLQSIGINSIRLRVWVNPADGWCNADDLLIKAKRARDLGMRIMIDFHYSDVWADPGKQTKPAAWNSLSLTDLKIALANHTKEVLTLLKENNVSPEWVQVGNETGNGMLWDTGKASVNMANYAKLTTAGYDAVKEVFPNAKVIVHLQNGQDNGLFRWIFDGLKENGGKWDIIGMSLYPYWYKVSNDWQAANAACLINMNDMVSRYNKEVMIVECGMSWDLPSASKDFLSDLIVKTKSVANGKGLGVFYWEPQSYGSWKGYSLGAFDINGRPTVAMDAFSHPTGIPTNKSLALKSWYDKQNQTITFSETLSSVRILSVNGVTMLRAENATTIQTNHLSSGVYLLETEIMSKYKVVAKLLID